MVTPRSFNSSALSLGSTLESIALARNAGAYCSSPSFRNQSVISIVIAGVMSNDAEHGLAGYSTRILYGRPLVAEHCPQGPVVAHQRSVRMPPRSPVSGGRTGLNLLTL